MVIFWNITGLTQHRQKQIGNSVFSGTCIILFIEQDTKWLKEKTVINYMIYLHVEFVDILFRFSIICI